MLNVGNKPIMLNVVMLNVLAPSKQVSMFLNVFLITDVEA